MNINKLFALAALTAMISFASCTKELLESAKDNGQQTEVAGTIKSLTITINADTKVALEDGSSTKLVWETGDQISVNGKISNPLTVGGASAEFTFPEALAADAEGKVTVVYPASAEGLSYTSGVYSFKVSRGLSAKASDFLQTSVMAGRGVIEGDGSVNLNLQHAMSYIKITPAESSQTINRIYVHGYENMVSGYFNIGFSGDDLALSLARNNYTYAVMDCSSMELSADDSYILAIPAGTYANGLYIKAVGGTKNQCSINTLQPSGFTAKGGKVLNLSNSYKKFDFQPTKEPYEVASQAEYDLLKYAFDHSWQTDWVGTKDGIANTIYLNADITATVPLMKMKDGSFDYVLEGNPENTFTYIINNSEASNNAPLLYVIGASAAVKNLNMVSTIKKYAKNIAPLAVINEGLIDNVENVTNIQFSTNTHLYCSGLVIANSGTISNSTIKGSIQITLTDFTANSSAQVAGFACAATESANQVASPAPTDPGNFIACTNEANITLHNKDTKQSGTDRILDRCTPVAGICATVIYGTAEKYSSFKDCINKGNIIFKEDASTKNNGYAVGGIVGRVAIYNSNALQVNSNIYAKFEGCSNSGEIVQAAKPTQTFGIGSAPSSDTGARVAYAGGIIGAASGLSSNPISLNDCHNESTISGGFNKDMPGVVLGGLVGFASYVDLTDCTSKTVIGDSPLANPKVSAIGGLLGYVNKPSSATNCSAYLDIDASGTTLSAFSDYSPQYFYGLGCAALSQIAENAATMTFTNCQFGGIVTALLSGISDADLSNTVCSQPNDAVTCTGVTFDLNPGDI